MVRQELLPGAGCVIQPSYQWTKLKIYGVVSLDNMLNTAMC